MVETLGIIIDRRPKGRPRKMESQTIEKIGCIPILSILLITFRSNLPIGEIRQCGGC